MLKERHYLIVIAALIAVIFFLRSCNGDGEMKDLYEAAQDSLVQYRNENGEQVSKIALMTAESERAFLQMKTSDSTILKLQDQVREYKGKLIAATRIITVTGSEGNTVTTITKFDTIENVVYPQYETTWQDKWQKGYIHATKDSIYREIKLFNEFAINIGFERQGFLKRRIGTVSVVNLNPYTETTELRSFHLDKQKRIFSIGLIAGYGISLSNYKISPIAGIGISLSPF